MRARLAFAAATVTSPEILLVDEILGVGDGYSLGSAANEWIKWWNPEVQ